MGKTNLNCAEQLKYLMETHKPKLENANDLSRAMLEAGIFEFSKKPNVTGKESVSYRASTIRNHLKGGNVDSEFLIAYCDFFHCSADYLLGYISSPTHAVTDIAKETGLWEENIAKIKEFGSFFLNALISSDNFWAICLSFVNCLNNLQKAKYFGQDYFKYQVDLLDVLKECIHDDEKINSMLPCFVTPQEIYYSQADTFKREMDAYIGNFMVQILESKDFERICDDCRSGYHIHPADEERYYSMAASSIKHIS